MKARKNTFEIIVHHSLSREVTLEEMTAWHIARKFSTIGYHRIIHMDGTESNGRSLHLIGAHAKGRNSESIGVCLTGDFSKYSPTIMQYLRLAEYCKSIRTIYNNKAIPIKPHHELCPGEYFDWAFFEGLIHA